MSCMHRKSPFVFSRRNPSYTPYQLFEPISPQSPTFPPSLNTPFIPLLPRRHRTLRIRRLPLLTQILLPTISRPTHRLRLLNRQLRLTASLRLRRRLCARPAAALPVEPGAAVFADVFVARMALARTTFTFTLRKEMDVEARGGWRVIFVPPPTHPW
jgi:hypothetical protein